MLKLSGTGSSLVQGRSNQDNRPTMPGGGPHKVRQDNHSALLQQAGLTRFAALPTELLQQNKQKRGALINLMPHYGVFVTQVWPDIQKALLAREASDALL